MDSLIESFVTLMRDKLPGELVVFIISLLPVLELRGGLIAASLLDIEWYRAFIFCFLGNMLPIPFILLFIRKILDVMRRHGPFKKIVDLLERKAEKHSKKIDQYRLWGLFILVAIPLPGTGAWTGALVAALLGRRLSHAMLSIGAGVMTACCIVALLCKGIIHIAGL